MSRGRASRHARPSGRGALAAAYDDLRRELGSVRSAHWNDQLELIRLTALTQELTGQVGSLAHELAAVRSALEVARSTPPLVVREPYPVPAEPPAVPAPLVAVHRDDLLLSEMAELRRLVSHQQQLLADLTLRLLDLLARFVPAAPAPPGQATHATHVPPATPPTAEPSTPEGVVLDDETATRLRVIREAFGR